MKRRFAFCAVTMATLLLLMSFVGCGKKKAEPEKPDASTIIDSDTNDKVDGSIADDTVVDDNSVEVDFETGETKPAPSKKTTATQSGATTTTGSQSTATTVTDPGNTTTTAAGATTTKKPDEDTMGNKGTWGPWQ